MPAQAGAETDRALVERVKAGDRQALAQLHDRYYPRVYRFALIRTGNPDDAADIASETFCRALRHLSNFQFKRTTSLYPWLHQIAFNLVIDGARARAKARVCSLDARVADDIESFVNLLPDDGPSPQELVERGEVQEILLSAISELPASQEQAISFRFLGQLSIREIAREMDRSEGAVKSLLHRALQNLRQTILARAAEARGETRARYTETGGARSHVQEIIHIRTGDPG